MFDVGWTELLVIGVLALIVVGPRDLPQLLRTVGQWVGKIKRMAREFQRTMEDAAREADITEFKELRDLKKEMGNLDLRKQASKARSYLNKPVKLESEGAAAGTTESAAKGASTTPAAAPAGEAASASDTAGAAASAPAETANASAEESGMAAADESEPRQAGAEG